MDIHMDRFHAGTSNVLARLRQDYWIPKARQTIKKVLRGCVTCKRLQGKPFQSAVHAPLPKERVESGRPFSVTGLDYSGYLLVKDGNRVVKVYISLFTCAITRAVHLEIVENLTEYEFLCAFRRFVARRSTPKLLISDNASTFVSAAKTLDIYAHPLVQSYMNVHAIEWRFIIKRAPWTGGFYERMIGLTKQSLRKVLGSSLVSLNDLRTLIVEIEAGLNDRPLTYVSNDIDAPEAINPSHLLLGHRLDALPDISEIHDINDPSYGEKPLIDRMSVNLSSKLNAFWKRWRMEYLTALRERHNQTNKDVNNNVKVGQVVLVHDDNLPRIRWKLAVIEELYPGADGVIRSVKIRTSNGITNRPVVKLYPLEVDSMQNAISRENSIVTERPKRAAAIAAREKFTKG